jgi:formate hydrogenlyase subunit 4
VAQALHIALMLAVAPTLAGALAWLQARLQGRAGPPLLAPWHRLARLCRKQPIRPETATVVSAAAPLAVFASVAAAAALVPSFALGMAFASLADLLVIGGLLALAATVLALAGFDSGDAVGGVGAGRTMAIAGLAEPALLLVVLGFGLFAGDTNLGAVAAAQFEGAQGAPAAWGLGFGALVLLVLADTAQSPCGPSPRTEFGMLREALTLTFSGRDLALIEAAAALQRLVWLSLIAALCLPFGLAPAAAAPVAWLVGRACRACSARRRCLARWGWPCCLPA